MTVDDVMELLALVNPPVTGMIRSSNVTMQCPFAAVSGHQHTVDRTPSLGIRPDDQANGGVWNCFSCGRKGDIAHFFRLLEKELGYDCTRATERLSALLYLSPAEIAASVPTYESHFLPQKPTYRVFPESWLAPYAGRVAQKLLDRGVTLETCRAWGIGFDRKLQRIVYPVRDVEGKLVGAVGGAVNKGGPHDPKYKNYWHRCHASCGFPLEHHNGVYYCPNCDGMEVKPEFAHEGFRKARHLFGAQMFGLFRPGEGEEMWADPRQGKPAVAVVVEGVVDALMVYQATRGFRDAYGFPVLPLALLGSSPSQEQANLLVRLTGDRRVVAFLDNDQAGRKGDVELYDLVGTRLRYHRATYPEDSAGADPGSLGPEAVRAAILEAKVVMRSSA